MDGDGVGFGIVGDAEVHRLPDVPELDVVAAVDLISFQGYALLIDIEPLAAGAGHESRCCLRRGTADSDPRQDARRYQGDLFSSAVHDRSSLYCSGLSLCKHYNT